MSLTLFVGPVAVGKSTVWKEILENSNEYIAFKTHTSRRMREEETLPNAIVNYHFQTKEKFMDLIAADFFFEYVDFEYENIGTVYYGTGKSDIEEAISSDKHYLAVVDIRGALDIKAKYPEVFSVFISPPSVEELEKRVYARGSEVTEEILERLRIAKEREIPNAHKMDYVVVNHSVEQCAKDIIQKIESRIQLTA